MEKSRFVLYGRTVALLVTIIGILILAPILNTIGLAITFVISAAAHAITLIYFDRRYVQGTNHVKG
jgi:O-antigen/teichoic acid export membrane protein